MFHNSTELKETKLIENELIITSAEVKDKLYSSVIARGELINGQYKELALVTHFKGFRAISALRLTYTEYINNELNQVHHLYYDADSISRAIARYNSIDLNS